MSWQSGQSVLCAKALEELQYLGEGDGGVGHGHVLAFGQCKGAMGHLRGVVAPVTGRLAGHAGAEDLQLSPSFAEEEAGLPQLGAELLGGGALAAEALPCGHGQSVRSSAAWRNTRSAWCGCCRRRAEAKTARNARSSSGRGPLPVEGESGELPIGSPLMGRIVGEFHDGAIDSKSSIWVLTLPSKRRDQSRIPLSRVSMRESLCRATVADHLRQLRKDTSISQGHTRRRARGVEWDLSWQRPRSSSSPTS